MIVVQDFVQAKNPGPGPEPALRPGPDPGLDLVLDLDMVLDLVLDLVQYLVQDLVQDQETRFWSRGGAWGRMDGPGGAGRQAHKKKCTGPFGLTQCLIPGCGGRGGSSTAADWTGKLKNLIKKSIRMTDRQAQHVGRVLTSGGKSNPEPSLVDFDAYLFAYFPWWVSGQPWVLSTLGGAK